MSGKKQMFKRIGKGLFRFGRNRLLDGVEMHVMDILDNAATSLKGVSVDTAVGILRSRIQEKFLALRDGRPNKTRTYHK